MIEQTQVPAATVAQPPLQESWRTYFDMFLRWWWVILISAIVAGGAAFVVSLNQTAIYRASAKMLINQASNSTNPYQDMVNSGRAAQTYAQWMSQKVVVDRTVALLGLPNDSKLIAEQITSLTAAPQGDSQIVQLTVEGPNRELILAFARTLPQVFARWVEEVQTSRYAETKSSLSSRMESLTREIETTQNAIELLGETRDFQQQVEYNRLSEDLSRLRNSYNNLAQTYEQLLLTEAQSVDTIAVLEEATLQAGLVQPRPLRTTALALVVGGMVATGLVYL